MWMLNYYSKNKGIVADILNYPNVSHLSNEDILSIKHYRRNSQPSGSYADTWCYLTQAAHMEAFDAPLGLKYSDGKTIIILGVFIRPADTQQREHVHIIRPSGSWKPELIRDIAKYAYSLTGTPVYLKKLSENQLETLKTIGFEDAYDYPWHDRAPEEDDTYPEIIISLDTFVRSLTKGSDSEIRRKYQKYNKVFKSELVFTPYKALDEEIAADIVDDFFSERYPQHAGISDPSDYINMIQHSNRVSPEQFGIHSWIVQLQGAPVGFFVAERTSNKETCGLYASIVLYRDIEHLGKGISEFIWANCFLRLHEAGIKYVNLGGSESIGLHRFKEKFMRVADGKSYQMRWAVWPGIKVNHKSVGMGPFGGTANKEAINDKALVMHENIENEKYAPHDGPKVQAVLIFINVIMGISLWQALESVQLSEETSVLAKWGSFAVVVVNLLRTFLGFVSFEMNKGLADAVTRYTWNTRTGEDKPILQTCRLFDFLLGMVAAIFLIPLASHSGQLTAFANWFVAVSFVFVVRNTGLKWFYSKTIKQAGQIDLQPVYDGDLIINPLVANYEMAKFWLVIDIIIVLIAIIMRLSISENEIVTITEWSALIVMSFEMWQKRRYYFASGTLETKDPTMK